MPTDNTLAVRQAVVAHLKAAPSLTALISASRIYGEQPPADPDWPFIRYGLAVTLPYEAQGWSGSEHAIDIHAFANGPYTDAVLAIAKQVQRAMDTLAAPGDTGIVALEWTGMNVVRDSPPTQAAKYHAIINFTVTVAG